TTTGGGTLVGSFNTSCDASAETMADITFASDGTLYGWSEPNCDSLFTIDKSSGAATLVGTSGLSTTGSGTAANSTDTIYLAGEFDNGPLYTIDRFTGEPTQVATLTGTAGNPVAALSFDSNDVLYGV